MEITFVVNQKSKDFIPASSVITFKDNIEWDEEMISTTKSMLAELYDCSQNEICLASDFEAMNKLFEEPKLDVSPKEEGEEHKQR